MSVRLFWRVRVYFENRGYFIEIRSLSFTGSTSVGKYLYRESAESMKKLGLELGGNAPFIVFDDCNLEDAVKGAIASKFRNSGQTCICANRILVQEGVYDQFVSKFVTAVKQLKVAHGLQEDCDIGPLINQAAIDNTKRLVDDAMAKGGHIECGGKPHALGQFFYEPTVLTHLTRDMAVYKEECFAPLAPMYG